MSDTPEIVERAVRAYWDSHSCIPCDDFFVGDRLHYKKYYIDAMTAALREIGVLP